MGTKQEESTRTMSITHIHERTTPPAVDYEAAERVAEPVADMTTDRLIRLGGALEEIRTVDSENAALRALTAEQASTIRERDVHIAYLERRVEHLEAEVGVYMRTSVALAQQQKAIAQLCEQGRQLAAAAIEAEGPSDEA
jgi:diphthamide synthase (EF-2-diphthine--ammonia ligase)